MTKMTPIPELSITALSKEVRETAPPSSLSSPLGSDPTSMPIWRTRKSQGVTTKAAPLKLYERVDFSGEIKREGQRTLKKGVNVWVQLKQEKKTKRTQGHIVECFEDGTVMVDFGDFQKQIPVNEFIKARTGTTKV